MTTRDISEQVKNLYDVEISAEMVSNITNRIMPASKYPNAIKSLEDNAQKNLYPP